MKAPSLRWVAGFGLAGIIHVALFWAIAIIDPPEREPAYSSDHYTVFEYVKTGTSEESALEAEQIELFDPRPLLLPTKWNAGTPDKLSDFIEDEREIFEDFEPQFRSGDGNFAEAYGNEWRKSESVVDAQVDFEADILDAFGRKAEKAPSVGREGFEARVLDPQTGEEIVSERIYNNEALGALMKDWPDWQPAQFVINVEDSFVVREMTVARSSGSSEADETLRELALSGILRRGTLKDGSYLVKIGL